MRFLVFLSWAGIACLAAANDSQAPAFFNHAGDYTFGYYPYGWRGVDTIGDRLFAIQTNEYSMALNTTRGTLVRIGAAATNIAAQDAVTVDNTLLDSLPQIGIAFSISANGKRYTLAQGPADHDDFILQRLGKYLTHVEMRNLKFRAEDGSLLSPDHAWYEVYAWTDRLSIVLHSEIDSELSVVVEGGDYALSPASTASHYLFECGDRRISLANPDSVQHFALQGTESCTVSSTGKRVALILVPTMAVTATSKSDRVLREVLNESERVRVEAIGIAPYTKALTSTFEAIPGWHRIALGENGDKNVTDRVSIRLENPSPIVQTVRLNFEKVGGPMPITGMSPILRDKTGLPLGVPVQISKNWHVRPAWFNGLTMIDMDPGEVREIELLIAHAHWGGVPAVSHAQLSLVGWGTNQQWDQMALGSFGESICYDPDINLNRSMIDDMRPLMVWGMGQESRRQWSWTHNVGGGDFLVMFQNKERQYLRRQKTLYSSYGPVMSDVTYAGETPDGAIQSRIRTRTWRTDDFVRGFYSIRYDVVQPVEQIDRLAFFQLGADKYNHNLFDTISRGDFDGIQESWTTSKGGSQYSRQSLALEGDQPWIAFTGSKKNEPPIINEGDQGAWANRGFIVRSWHAKLNGASAPQPYYAVYGTDDGKLPSAIAELAPPPGLTELKPGDFVETDVEMVILPVRLEDYYGPNLPLRDVLAAYPDSWKAVHREAAKGRTKVNAIEGTLVSEFPIVVSASNHGKRASFRVVGGTGYMPLTIRGSASPGPFTLVESSGNRVRGIDQSTSIENDWWDTRFDPQTGKYDLVFTLPVESDSDNVRTYEWTLEDPT
ncbi:MAG: hypothetical protein AMXMBFR84_49330 [Candidatus Hydrogenedentota bacterium]